MKSDHLGIREALNNLKSENWLDESRRWWPNYLFHFTDITNAVNILEKAKLLCRSQIESTSEHKKDIASPEVLQGTKAEWKNYVRLYFRPKTPMLFQIEGIRPKGQLKYGGAHCPVPVVFMFNSLPILTREEVRFSDGNLASTFFTKVGENAEFFKKLPFEKIYHSGSLHRFIWYEKSGIIRNRHAEVIVPKELDLEELSLIWCRTQAEFETLIHLISEETYERWKEKIGVANRIPLFYENWTFVKKVVYHQSSVEFIFNHGFPRGPFNVKVTVKDMGTGKTYSYSAANKNLGDSLDIRNPDKVHGKFIEVLFTIDDHIAYNCTLGNPEHEEPF